MPTQAPKQSGAQAHFEKSVTRQKGLFFSVLLLSQVSYDLTTDPVGELRG